MKTTITNNDKMVLNDPTHLKQKMELPDKPNEIDVMGVISILWEHFPKNTKIALHTYVSGNRVEEEDMLRDIIQSLKIIPVDSEKFNKIVTLLNTFIEVLDMDME